MEIPYYLVVSGLNAISTKQGPGAKKARRKRRAIQGEALGQSTAKKWPVSIQHPVNL
jgi:hypothetical protein